MIGHPVAADPPRQREILRALAPIGRPEFAAVRNECMLQHCKWDPQVGDRSSLADFALAMSAATWNGLRQIVEQMAAEVVTAEQEIARRPELHSRLGIPERLRRLWKRGASSERHPAMARSLRFDFHLTDAGWLASEVNSDVPGGFCEAEHFASLMAASYSGLRTAGAPGSRWADAVQNSLRAEAHVALMSAAPFMEDHQVVAYLATRLGERGLRASLIGPEQLEWHEGRPRIADETEDLDAVVRFFQAEWLADLPQHTRSEHFFGAAQIPVTNDGRAIFTESKRLLLVRSDLDARMDALARYFPDTREPTDAPWLRERGWVLKAAYGNAGDAVAARGWSDAARWRRAAFRALRHPSQWVAQRRFRTLPIASARGPVFPCIGVHTLDGHATGIYGRIASSPIVDALAQDIAVLIEGDDEPS